MKRFLVSVLLLGSMSALIAGAYAQEAKKEMPAKAGKASMSKYMVISPHTAEQCLQALDDVQAMGPQMLNKWDFGCMDNDHTGYSILNASSAEEALKSVPESVRGNAKAVKLHKYTAAELKGYHEKMKS